MIGLAGLGISFLTDLIGKYGEPLIAKGIEKVTGIDVTKKELTQEEKQKIIDSEIKLKQLDFEKLKLEYENVNNARDMQKQALSQDDIFSKRYVYYLATFWSFVAFTYIFLITFLNIPADNIRFADTVLGFLLGTVIATILNFFFGSSKGSSDKQDIINKISK